MLLLCVGNRGGATFAKLVARFLHRTQRKNFKRGQYDAWLYEAVWSLKASVSVGGS